MNPLSLLDNDWWAGLYRSVSSGAEGLLEGLYEKANRLRIGPLAGGAVLQAILLNVCLCLPYVIFDWYRVRVFRVLEAVLPVGIPQLADAPDALSAPRLYPIAHAVFLLSLFVPRSKLPAVVVGGIVALGVALGLFDLVSVLVLFLFVSVVYLIMNGRWAARSWKLAVVVVSYLVFLNVCPWLGALPDGVSWLAHPTPPVVRVSWSAAGFVPLLWYACYEACAGRLTYVTCHAYFLSRLLMAPVFPVKDLMFYWAQRRRWQWRGVFTLGIAFAALSVRWHLGRTLDAAEPAWQTTSGPRLLGFSYAYYVYRCCGLVARFNLFIGWARLFGIPIRSAFHFWLLARTPNERWRRWNLLFREWIITYVFYPMMRARKGLFVSIMATLLLSGVIHLAGKLTPDRLDLMEVARVMLYWLVNGLAIYVVVMIPRTWPDLIDRLKMRESVLWSLVGIAMTSSIYSILYVLRDTCTTWADMASYLRQLVRT